MDPEAKDIQGIDSDVQRVMQAARDALTDEMVERAAITVAEGADLVMFSGDKLLGGPQAGFIVGRRTLVQEIKRNPLKRALRADKIRLAAIEATLKLYRDPQRLKDRLPTLRHLARPQGEIAAQAQALAPLVAAVLGAEFSVAQCDCASEVGSGASPLDSLASAGLCIRAARGDGALRRLAMLLRQLDKPIIGRIQSGSLILDLRCLDDDRGFLEALAKLDKTALAERSNGSNGA